MDRFEKATGFCTLRHRDVDIVFVKLKASTFKSPVSCHNSRMCPHTESCRFANSASDSIPVDWNRNRLAVEAS